MKSYKLLICTVKDNRTALVTAKEFDITENDRIVCVDMSLTSN